MDLRSYYETLTFLVIFSFSVLAISLQAPPTAIGLLSIGWALILWGAILTWFPLASRVKQGSLAARLLSGLLHHRAQQQHLVLNRILTQRLALLTISAVLLVCFQIGAIFAPPPQGSWVEVMNKIGAVLQAENVQADIHQQFSQDDMVLILNLLLIGTGFTVGMLLSLRENQNLRLIVITCIFFFGLLAYLIVSGSVAAGRLLPLPLWPSVLGHGALPSGLAAMRDMTLFEGAPSSFHLRLYESGWMGTLCVYGLGLQIFFYHLGQAFFRSRTAAGYPRLGMLILLSMMVADLLWQADGRPQALFFSGWTALGVLWASPAVSQVRRLRMRQI
ncbi:MAG: hypothetical protein L6Q57_06615 [Alphaproteobacteria bacterium]|nr:hypothetical protein [Alphaproteobacteria bacterium]